MVAPMSDPIDQALPTVMRELREARGETQEDVASGAGLTVGSFARVEQGKANPGWATVLRIADALDVSMAELGARVDRLR